MGGQSLLAAVLASPDDDMPRLIYADWLDEQGECDRAEFIRVQCRVAELMKEYSGEVNDTHALRRRERELLRGPRPEMYEHEVCWFHEGDGTDTWRFLFRPQWRRGFVEGITCDWGRCAAHLDAILCVQPVRRVTLTTSPVVSYQHETDHLRGIAWLRNGGKRLPVTTASGLLTREEVVRLLEIEWDGVKFTLPPAVPTTTLPGAYEYGRRLAEERERSFWEAFTGRPLRR